MAKQVYKIPESLDKNMGDMEIALQSSDGIGSRPIPVSILLGYLGSVLLWFFVITNTFISAGGGLVITLFSIEWAIMTRILLKQDKTGLSQFHLIPTMLTYLPKNMRYVITRKSSPANMFASVVGLNYDAETGIIDFNDGHVGCIYRVVGTGSILLFDEDRNMVLDRVDQFYRKFKEDSELIFVTAKESQKIYRQVSNLVNRVENLDNKDPDLLSLLDMQYNCLKHEVGGTYRSIHQYMILRSANYESFLAEKNIILSEVENSQLMFKQCVELSGDDGEEVFKTIFQGKESV